MPLTNDKGHSPNPIPNPFMKGSTEQTTDLGTSKKSTASQGYPEELSEVMDLISKMADRSEAKALTMALAKLYALEKIHCGDIYQKMYELLMKWSETQTEKSAELTEKTKEAIESLSSRVVEKTTENRRHLDEALAESQKCRAELRETTESEKDFKRQISKEISGMIITTGSELKATLEEEISAPVNCLKEELDSCKEDVKRQRKRIEHEGRFQFALRLINVVSLVSIFFMVLISFFV